MADAELHQLNHGRKSFWDVPEHVEAVKVRYIERGEPCKAVAADLGCTPDAVRRYASNRKWKRDPAFYEINQATANRERFPEAAARAEEATAPKPVAVHARQRFTFGAATPIVFAAPPVETETLGDRILRELSAKPLSAASLATLLGEKELLVSMQLSAFAHEGRVEAGPVGDRGLRYRVWSVVDQYPSRALPAASLRCGPDSLIVAGEAA